MSDRRHIMDMGHKDAGGRRLTAAISDSFVMIIFFFALARCQHHNVSVILHAGFIGFID